VYTVLGTSQRVGIYARVMKDRCSYIFNGAL
jgi:hypothetical protein